jgi:broad specificity phosphatase PhoE
MQSLIVRVLFPLCLIGLTLSIGWGWRCTDDTTTTVLLVRHAEKAAQPRRDPDLTPAGEVRAANLAHVAGEAGVTTIFATNWVRTKATAADLEAALGLTAVIPDGGPVELAELILADHRGETVVVVGHSNTLPEIIDELGGPALPQISDDTYDTFFVLTVRHCGGVQLLKLKYGDAAP